MTFSVFGASYFYCISVASRFESQNTWINLLAFYIARMTTSFGKNSHHPYKIMFVVPNRDQEKYAVHVDQENTKDRWHKENQLCIFGHKFSTIFQTLPLQQIACSVSSQTEESRKEE